MRIGALHLGVNVGTAVDLMRQGWTLHFYGIAIGEYAFGFMTRRRK